MSYIRPEREEFLADAVLSSTMKPVTTQPRAAA
jgi:hypothetical protein